MSHPVCPACNRQLSADFLKCPYCGADLESLQEPVFINKKICRKCGNELSGDDRFCMVCGTPVNEADVPEEAVIPESLSKKKYLTFRKRKRSPFRISFWIKTPLFFLNLKWINSM